MKQYRLGIKGTLECVAVVLPDGDQLTEVQLVVVNLSDKDGSHRLVQRRAVHVDGGSNRKDEASNLSVDVAVLQQTLHGDGQRGRAEDGQHSNKNFVGDKCERHIKAGQSWTLTWRRWPGRSPGPAAARGCR